MRPRPRIDGKFLAIGDERLWVRGVTYGTFRPDGEGQRFGTRAQVETDFAAMAAQGINAVRTYTAPPPWLLDAALNHGLWVMAGLPWEQHVAFLDDRRRAADIATRIAAQAEGCARHPALLCYAVGNEIPTPIVRWHGRHRVERFLERLCGEVRKVDRGGLLTYVNYPSTEYLRLPFVDMLAFNVYLNDAHGVSRYVSRLQNLAGDRPLLLAELGADSRSLGREQQAAVIGSQVDAAFAGGCAGTFVFAYTDEWHRGDDEVLDWDFGVTDRERRPKPALSALHRSYATAGRAQPEDPDVSVVVCTYNGSATLRRCLEGLAGLRYPRYEVIVVDDGSTDGCADIASRFDVRLIRTENRGLSAARNAGLAAARGEIVAYIDDDAWPDPDWLRFLAVTFRSTSHAAAGGPNLPPDDESAVAACVANAPGGPIHVLVSDTEAEHLPGCNMAYRRDALLAIGGFDPQFRAAGDDVDVCWRLQERGETLGFHPAAIVWHRRRSSIRGFWRQQLGYGKAEALLERKWPERYNNRGHVSWAGRMYDRASTIVVRPTRIYHGVWGTGAFQPEEPLPDTRLTELARTPEWYILVAGLCLLASMAVLLPWLAWVLVPLAAASAVSIWGAALGAGRADLSGRRTTLAGRLALRGLIAWLHLMQPAARLAGRLSLGLAPWRQNRVAGLRAPVHVVRHHWFETWLSARDRVASVEASARTLGARCLRGGAYDRWDLEIRGGATGAVRLRLMIEDHGRGRQVMRCRIWPRVARQSAWVAIASALLCTVAVVTDGWIAAGVFGTGLVACVTLAVAECAMATATALAAFETSTRLRDVVPTRSDSAVGDVRGLETVGEEAA
jgi:GT2 family glycosyltransferase